MITRRLSAALASAALLALTACGGSSSPGTSSEGKQAAKPSPLSSPATEAAAAKINLTTADLPGYKATPHDDSEDDADEKKAEDDLATCVGATTTDSVADYNSDDFSKGEQLPSLNVSSDVEFMADAQLVQSDLAAFKSDKATSCLQKFVREALASAAEGATLIEPTVTRLPASAPGADGAFGFRMATGVQAAGTKVPITFDILGVAKGRTEVTLIVIGAGTDVPDAQRDALFAKLVQRTTANAL